MPTKSTKINHPRKFVPIRNFSEPAGVRVHPNFVAHLQSSSEVCCL